MQDLEYQYEEVLRLTGSQSLTQRLRGVGNGALAFDDFLGMPEDRNGGCTGRFGPWIAGATALPRRDSA